jgi:hypothetical protein
MVDLVLGPTLTLIVANPAKRRRLLARDVTMIVAVQLVALVYGAATLWQGRPLYYAFSVNSLDMVQASDVDPGELRLARQQNPSLAPNWYSLPRWIWAPLPADPAEASKIVNGVVLSGGHDVTDMPRYFKPWDQGLPKLREQLALVSDIKYLSKAERQSLQARMSAQGLTPDERNALIMWGGTRRVLAVFDPASLRVKALLKAD